MARVYVETTIPSFYHEARGEPDMVARRAWTREWWGTALGRDQLVTGPPVIAELERGTFSRQLEALALIADLPVLEISEPVLEIVEAYIVRKVMPADPAGDALHLALASFHRCDFLATWNCRHLANARKFQHIRRVNAVLGVHVPALVTPLELLGEEEPS
jgi:predicted nucleic acid-binding protein